MFCVQPAPAAVHQRAAAPGRSPCLAAVRVVGFRDDSGSARSRLQRAGSKVQQAASKAGSKVQQAGSKVRPSGGRGSAAAPARAGTSSTRGKKQPTVMPLGKPPSNARENAESVVTFVMIAGFFLTGVLFVSIPAFQVGGTALTKSWQKGVNKSVGIKEPRTFGQEYAPGPGPAAAPESPAAQM